MINLKPSSYHLPNPDSEAQYLSQQLQASIFSEITEQGRLTFARYMELVLYAPNLGYYCSGTQKFGEQGDFITAPELSPLFSQCIARQCQQVLLDINGGDIVEFGAGSGIMASTILQYLAEQDALPSHYYVVELSAELRSRQQILLQSHIPTLFSRVVWLDRLPDNPLRGVILANEVLDAMPVHRFGFYDGIQEYYVASKNQQLIWQLDVSQNELLREQIKQLGVNFPNGYSSEINLLAKPWLTSLAAIIEQGLILLTDYGMTQREFYHWDRSCGTLMCHYRHRAHSNPFWWPGLQDITSQVDFSAIAEAAIECDLNVEGFTHQAAFLLNCGIVELMDAVKDPMLRFASEQQVKRLVLPGQMGEPFKAMALTKNYSASLLGFSTMNQIERL